MERSGKNLNWPKGAVRFPQYSMLPPELRIMIVQEVASEMIYGEPILNLLNWRDMTQTSLPVQSLLLVNREMNVLVRRCLPSPIKISSGKLSQNFFLDLAASTLVVPSMRLPSMSEKNMTRGGDRPADALQPPFRKLISVWDHYFRPTMIPSAHGEVFQPRIGNARLPELKEATFLTNSGRHLGFDIEDFGSENLSQDNVHGYALGNTPAGVWVGFRYHKDTGRVQFTPLIYNDVEFAFTVVAESGKWSQLFYPLMIRVWIMDRGENPPDEPHHKWTDVRNPGPFDPLWVSNVCGLWELARKTLEGPRYSPLRFEDPQGLIKITKTG
ncbi:hypothetical protein BGZ61DRAFT_527121 [Ilyonectria robusta]|uniref:uncharacterized protein n=1 Tax=Ilyonectria robusta TaxID=1079257 RepID=UPI001E8E338A|nr:uncharacterized protein BGZ61DRAFT_527121 [Ilyonectria robusta]KAH8736132.1 hypothetical protein BGZ61DRAFT_527121 [Ilyonectria robusta]